MRKLLIVAIAGVIVLGGAAAAVIYAVTSGSGPIAAAVPGRAVAEPALATSPSPPRSAEPVRAPVPQSLAASPAVVVPTSEATRPVLPPPTAPVAPSPLEGKRPEELVEVRSSRMSALLQRRSALNASRSPQQRPATAPAH